MSTCLCLFLKVPLPGQVKTRLAAGIGARRAAELYRAFLLDTLAWAARFPVSNRRVEYSPPSLEAICAALLPPVRRPWDLHPQAEGDLGDRLHAAFSAMFRAGYQRCVIIGTDCPLLGPREMRLAFRALESADLVLGPSLDGGYYLVGLRRPAPSLFEAMPWSTERVFELSMRRAESSGMTTTTLPCLGDIDTVGDLPALYSELVLRWRAGKAPFPIHTFRTLQWQVFRPYRRRR